MEENKLIGEMSEVYEFFPFMESFPFDEYSITLDKEGSDPIDLGISPIILNTLGYFGTETKFNFSYIEKEKVFSISFYEEDIVDIIESSKLVKKMNAISATLSESISSSSILTKLEAVKMGKKFIKSLKIPNLLFAPMRDILEDILLINETTFPVEWIVALQKTNIAKVESFNMTSAQKDACLSFLNFQLNYAKILLGIVIASKIH